MWRKHLCRLLTLWLGTHCGVWSPCCRSLPSAWLALLILAEISLLSCPSLEITLPGYLKLLTVFISMPSIVMVDWGALLFGAGWKRTSAIPSLMVRPNSLEASKSLFSMVCRSLDLCAKSAQSSANQCCLDSIRVIDLAVSQQRLNMEPPKMQQIYAYPLISCTV